MVAYFSQNMFAKNYQYWFSNSKVIIKIRTGCSETVFMWQCVDYCGCVVPIFAFTDVQLRRSNQTVCLSQTTEDGRFPTSPTELRDGFRTYLCFTRKEADIKTCSCRLPCDENIYDITVSTSGPWPHQSYRRPFYEQFISGKQYQERLKHFAQSKVHIF